MDWGTSSYIGVALIIGREVAFSFRVVEIMRSSLLCSKRKISWLSMVCADEWTSRLQIVWNVVQRDARAYLLAQLLSSSMFTHLSELISAPCHSEEE